MRVGLATGWTAGHVTPALAVAAAFGAAQRDTEVMFFGSAAGFEQRLVTSQGHRFETVPAAPLYGVSAGAKVRAAGLLLTGTRYARRLLARENIELVVGFGAYASAATVLAARTLGLACAVHEANVTPGLTNRLLGRLVDRMLMGWDNESVHTAGALCRYTGTPIRADLAGLVHHPHPPPEAGRARLLVCGGSQGSRFLNRRIPELAAVLGAGGLAVEVRHQCGKGSAAEVGAEYAACGVTARVEPYFDDMAASYRWADYAISCAGAATLAELAAAGLPALIVPLGAAAHDHQAANAIAYASATGAHWVREDGWNVATVGRQLAALLGDREAWCRLAERTRAAACANAAAAVVAECDALLTTRRQR